MGNIPLTIYITKYRILKDWPSVSDLCFFFDFSEGKYCAPGRDVEHLTPFEN